MARADFVTALVLILLGLGVATESWRMPRFTEFGSSIWSAPGVVPGMIGIALAVMGAALLVRARREPTAVSAGDHGFDRGSVLRVATALALCLLFAGVLVGRVPFMLAAFLFTLAFVLVFDLRENAEVVRDRRRLIKRGALAVVVAGVTSFAIARIFQDAFFVRLP
jgi:hypothetical protein